MLRHLDLTDQQRDEIFKARHANAPQVHTQREKARSARKALRTISMTGQADAGQLDKLSNELGSATAELARIKVRTDGKIYQILTADQRLKLKERMTKRHAKHQKR